MRRHVSKIVVLFANLAAKANQQAMFQQGQPAVLFFTDDVKRESERIKARGAVFPMAPTQVTGATLATWNEAAATSCRSPS